MGNGTVAFEALSVTTCGLGHTHLHLVLSYWHCEGLANKTTKVRGAAQNKNDDRLSAFNSFVRPMLRMLRINVHQSHPLFPSRIENSWVFVKATLLVTVLFILQGWFLFLELIKLKWNQKVTRTFYYVSTSAENTTETGRVVVVVWVHICHLAIKVLSNPTKVDARSSFVCIQRKKK